MNKSQLVGLLLTTLLLITISFSIKIKAQENPETKNNVIAENLGN